MAAFYAQTLGLPETARHLNPDGSLRSVWLSLSSGAAHDSGFLAVEEGSEFGPSMFALEIAPSERADVLAALSGAGVPILKQSRWTIYVRDPAGNTVGLSHHPHDPL